MSHRNFKANMLILIAYLIYMSQAAREAGCLPP